MPHRKLFLATIFCLAWLFKAVELFILIATCWTKYLKMYLFAGIVWLLALIVGSPMWYVQRLEVG